MKSANIQSTLHKARYYLGEASLPVVSSHAVECESCFTQLARAAASGDKNLKALAINRIVKSKSVKITALVCAQKCKTEGNTLEDHLAQLPGMNFKTDCGEPVDTWAEPKDSFISTSEAIVGKVSSSASYRQLCSFGHVRRARGWVVGRMLEILHPVHPSNFLISGRGTEALSDHIKKMGWGKKKLNTHFLLFDVKNFYPSVRQNQEVVELLGLPECLVRHDIFTSPTTPITISGVLPLCISEEELVGAARQGLPQGKATSSLVAGILYGWLLEQVVPAHRFFYYGDDGGIVCNETDGETIAETLRGAMKSHPAGPFQLNYCKLVNFKDGFEFVKYWYRNTSYKDGIRRAPSYKSFKKFESKISNIIAKQPSESGLLKVAAYSVRWPDAFPRWKKSKIGKAKMWANVEAGIALGMQRAKMAQTQKAKKKIIIIKKAVSGNDA